MPLPKFDTNGNMPPGVYESTLDDAVAHFGTSTRARQIVAQRLRHIYEVAKSTGELRRFVVYGSFVTSKLEPNDVDVFMIFNDTFVAKEAIGEVAVLLDHGAAQAHFGASIFWGRPLGLLSSEQEAIEYWQVCRDQQLRGIVEIKERIP